MLRCLTGKARTHSDELCITVGKLTTFLGSIQENSSVATALYKVLSVLGSHPYMFRMVRN